MKWVGNWGDPLQPAVITQFEKVLRSLTIVGKLRPRSVAERGQGWGTETSSGSGSDLNQVLPHHRPWPLVFSGGVPPSLGHLSLRLPLSFRLSRLFTPLTFVPRFGAHQVPYVTVVTPSPCLSPCLVVCLLPLTEGSDRSWTGSWLGLQCQAH